MKRGNRKTIADTLRRAAELLENSEYTSFSCIALKRVLFGHDGTPPLPSVFSKEFTESPAARAYANLLGRLPASADFAEEEEGFVIAHCARILALCLAADLYEEGVNLDSPE